MWKNRRRGAGIKSCTILVEGLTLTILKSRISRASPGTYLPFDSNARRHVVCVRVCLAEVDDDINIEFVLIDLS